MGFENVIIHALLQTALAVSLHGVSRAINRSLYWSRRIGTNGARAGLCQRKATEAQHGMLFMTLDCGRLVYFDAFDYSLTYVGVYAGLPNAKMNAQIITDTLAELNRPMAPCKIHWIPPAVDDREPEHPVLPSVCLRASLVCVDPIDPAFMASSPMVPLVP